MEKNNLLEPLFEQEMPLIKSILRMENIGIRFQNNEQMYLTRNEVLIKITYLHFVIL